MSISGYHILIVLGGNVTPSSTVNKVVPNSKFGTGWYHETLAKQDLTSSWECLTPTSVSLIYWCNSSLTSAGFSGGTQIFSSGSLVGNPSYLPSYLSPSTCKRLEPKQNECGVWGTNSSPRPETGMGVGNSRTMSLGGEQKLICTKKYLLRNTVSLLCSLPIVLD